MKEAVIHHPVSSNINAGEQLREVFRVLAADKVSVCKLDKRLDDVAHKWDEVKKLQPQVKGSVEPVQVRMCNSNV